MFKALILTQKLIKHPHSTLSRQIISQTKDQLQYSPVKSPTKYQYSPPPARYSQQKPKSQSISQPISKEHDDKYPFNITQIQGTVKLFHQYQRQKVQDNLNHLIIDRKRQEIVTLAHLKTNILAVLNVLSLKHKQKILQRLGQVKEQIQTIDIFIQTSHNQTSTYSMVVYFHNSLMSEQFYKLSYKQFMCLPVYLKEVLILQRQSSHQLSYKEVLSSFSIIEPLSQHQNKPSLKQNDLQWFQQQQRQWIELPQCVDCLLKLEFQVSGIDQKILYLIAQSQSNRLQDKTKNKQSDVPATSLCSTCQILAEHRKEIDVHRKLSFQTDYHDHHKSEKHAHCDDCKQKSDIWICMVCSRVGCGRYKNADAYKHFVKSGHIITIDLQTQRVWNYLSDCFSHKLLKNINQPASSVRFPQINKDQSDKIEQSKLQGAFWQYCSVFSQEMERQRLFYQNIKASEEQKFLEEDSKLQIIISQLQKESEQKWLQIKRGLKKKSKVSKRQRQLQEKVKQQREILKEHEECLSADWLKNYLEKDEDIVNKKKQLEQLQVQLGQLLVQLSSN